MIFSNVHIWIDASRPQTLWAAVAPVVMGTALAFSDGLVHWPAALCALISAVLIQTGTNYSNDYYDYLKGTDNQDRIGPQRATQSGLVAPNVMRRAFIIAFSMAFFAGIFLIFRGGWPVLIIGILSILFGILYTGGPYPLGYHGLGDVFVLLFFGPVAVGGTYYVQTLELTNIAVYAGFSTGLLSVAILTVNNLRDSTTDQQSGKKTLTVRFGDTFARILYCGSVTTACLIPAVLVYFTGTHYYSLIAMGTPLFMLPSIRMMLNREAGVVLNKVLAATGKLLILYSIIFSAGWLI